jgi:hypothetical protein
MAFWLGPESESRGVIALALVNQRVPVKQMALLVAPAPRSQHRELLLVRV